MSAPPVLIGTETPAATHRRGVSPVVVAAYGETGVRAGFCFAVGCRGSRQVLEKIARQVLRPVGRRVLRPITGLVRGKIGQRIAGRSQVGRQVARQVARRIDFLVGRRFAGSVWWGIGRAIQRPGARGIEAKRVTVGPGVCGSAAQTGAATAKGERKHAEHEKGKQRPAPVNNRVY